MPETSTIDPGVAGMASGVAGLISQNYNQQATQANNMQQLQYNYAMYRKQRKDSLADWAMQNEYNHPSAVMARLRQAQLNPNLVYGNGQATTPAQQNRQTDTKQWTPQAPTMDMGSAVQGGISTYMDMKLREAQVDNVRANTSVAVQNATNKFLESLLIKGRTIGQANTNRKQDFDYGVSSELRDTQIDAAKYNLKSTIAGINKTTADTEYTKNQDERAEKMNVAQIASIAMQNQKTQHEIHKVSAELENLQLDGTLKKLEIAMKESGATFQDPWILRKIQSAFSNEGQSNYKKEIDQLIEELKANPKKYNKSEIFNKVFKF